MNISPINNNNMNFQGKIITKGTWTKELKETFLNNSEVKQLASGKKDIIALMKFKRAPKNDVMHFTRQPLYSLTLMSRPENPSFWDKIKTFFNLLPKIDVTYNYHGEASMQNIIAQRIDAENFKKYL